MLDDTDLFPLRRQANSPTGVIKKGGLRGLFQLDVRYSMLDFGYEIR